jgi:UDP-GlcNAc:undecaprenyl-phosphate GlcNAc-1-phosphate transferase
MPPTGTYLQILGLLTLVVSAATAWIATPWVIRLAERLGAVDHPGPRKVHALPVPRIGGVAVFAGFVAGLAFAAQATGNLLRFPTVTVYWSVLAAAAALMFMLGLVDDLRGLSFRVKFVVQIAAATAVWMGGFRVEILALPFHNQPFDLGLASLPVTVLWIVGVTNAINLLDGLDGLATGTALITTSAVAAIAVFREQTGAAAASVALVGSLLGFLRYNFNPARIFLGVVSIRGSQKGSTAVAVLVPLLVLGLPLVDTTLAIVRRAFRVGRTHRGAAFFRQLHQLFLPDRGHVHHRLIDVGMSHRGAVLVLYGVATILAGAALSSVFANSTFLAWLLLGLLAGTMLLAFGAVLARRAFVERRARSTPVVTPPSPPTAAERR